MRKLKYPLLFLLILSMLIVEGFGQYLHLSNRVQLTGNAIQPGAAYVGLFCKSGGNVQPETEETWQAVVQPEVNPEETEDNTELVPEAQFTTVDASYFDDALFIGDSRMVGMHDYSGLDNATYYAEVGLTIYSLFDDKIAPLADGSMGTIEQALQERQFGKIYLMVGINELGTGTRERFLETYRAAVEKIHALQPDALIFIQGILYVTESRSQSDAYINNPNIMTRNADIATLADNKQIFYIDVNEVYSDGNGNLSTEYSFDNAHLKGACYDKWVTFLMEHGIVK